MLNTSLLFTSRSFGFCSCCCFEQPLFIQNCKDSLLIFSWHAACTCFALSLTKFPNAYWRQTGVTIGDCAVPITQLIKEIQLTYIARVSMKSKFSLMSWKLRMRAVDPRAKYIMVIMNLIDDYAIGLYGAFFEGRKVDS